MHFIIKSGASKEEIEKIEKKLWPNGEKNDAAGFDAHKYNGVLKIKGDAMKIQKRLRDDWERTIN